MRVFVTHETNFRWAIDIEPEATVEILKEVIGKKTFFDTHDDKREVKMLDLVYGGTSLHNEWVLLDIGIKSGTTIKCELKVVYKPKLKVLLGYSGETLDIMDKIDPIEMPFSEIKSIISKRIGLPVSSYRLCLPLEHHRELPKTYKNITLDKYVELFDCNAMESYGLEIGSTINLEIWDGWKEFINACLSGHWKLVTPLLSYDKEERLFQRRVALHIAAHFNYAGLAQNMIRYRTRPDLPVGSHPSREWCSSSAHVETKKCAVHEACEEGSIDVLRILIKANILCFAAKDGKGRTPWAIVVQHFHKDCFEYLLARQWARKSVGKDISLSIVVYCRLMQWCERAKNRVLILYGRSKSSLNGSTMRLGALAGTPVAVDGLSNKAMSSLPSSSIPKPSIPAERLLPSIAKAKRRFKREKSTIFTVGRNRNDTSKFSFSNSITRKYSLADTERSSIYQSSNHLDKETSTSEEAESSNDQNDSESYIDGSIFGNDNSIPLTSYQTLPQSTFHHIHKSTGAEMSKGLQCRDNYLPNLSTVKPPGRLWNKNSFSKNGEKIRGIPLPPTISHEFRKPYFYWRGNENPIEEVLASYEGYRKCSARENAIQNLSLADTFITKSWLTRAGMAANITKRGVMKATAQLMDCNRISV